MAARHSASARNWTGYGADVAIEGAGAELVRTLVTDPQTSGGLLAACSPEDVGAVLDLFHRDGFADAAEIGRIVAGEPRVVVRHP